MKKILFTLLIALLLTIVVACDVKNSNPNATTPEATTPDVTTPDVTTPEVTTPEVTTPDVTTPEVTTPEVTTPDVTTPEVTTPEVTPDISRVLTVSEVLSLMEDYVIGETSNYEVSIYGLATSSSYDSKHDSYTLWLSDGVNDEAFMVYSAKLDSTITSNYEDEDALAGSYITVKGYLKLYQDKSGNIFYETCFLYASDSPTGYETSPIILSIDENGNLDSELLDFSDLEALSSQQRELFLAAVSKDYTNLNIYDSMTDTYFSYDGNLYCQSFEYEDEYYEYYYKKSGNSYYTLEDGVWYDTIIDEYGDEIPLTKQLFEYYVFIPHFELIDINDVLYSKSNNLYVIDASVVDIESFLNYWNMEDTVYENFYFEINNDGYFSIVGMTDIYYDVTYNDEAYLTGFGQVIINESDLGIEDTPKPEVTTPEVTTPDVTTPDEEIGLEEGTIIDTKEDITKLDEFYMPSTGNANVLVIPVSFSGYPATQSMLDVIEKGFFGTEEDTGWESLKTYYEKSSYNQLHISGTVTPWFTPKYSQNYYAKYFDEENYEYGSNIIMLEALEYFKNTYNYDEFDGDNDEVIDCVYMVYNVPIGGDGSDEEVETYWAYTYWQYDYEKQDYGTLATAYTYVWFGYEFFESSPDYNSEFVKINSETLIHESGHAMGLNDYYDYDDNDQYSNDGGYGYADMMDGNIGDHHPYSKLLMGWVKPTVINKSGIYEMTSFSTTGNFILIPAGDSYNSIYSEYFIIDLFTMSGLNEATMPTFYNVDKDFAGVRVSHINANIYLESDGYYYFNNNNTDSKYKEIRFIEADYNGSKFDCDYNYFSDDQFSCTESDDFFKVGGPIFGKGNFSNYKTYSNTELPFTMEVIELTSSSAKVKIIFK